MNLVSYTDEKDSTDREAAVDLGRKTKHCMQGGGQTQHSEPQNSRLLKCNKRILVTFNRFPKPSKYLWTTKTKCITTIEEILKLQALGHPELIKIEWLKLAMTYVAQALKISFPQREEADSTVQTTQKQQPNY